MNLKTLITKSDGYGEATEVDIASKVAPFGGVLLISMLH